MQYGEATLSDKHLKKLVIEWREAQKAIDRLSVEERRASREPLDRLVAAHNALLRYVDEEITG
jgi:hypothetical protein